MTRTTDLHTFLRTRRSIRRFKPDPVPDSVIQTLIHTAAFAPSAHNRQPWRFVIISNPDAKSRLSQRMSAEFQRDLEKDKLSPEDIQKKLKRSHERMTGAPVVIILCVDMSEMDEYPDTRRKKAEYIIATQSTANAGMQLLLAAHAEGLGGVWVCSPIFAQETVQNALEIPQTWEPQAMFLLGYPENQPSLRERKPIEEVTKFIK
ncbi:MAG: nitroreductase family protein [Anaerolineales bacterium]|nr:nitroreductase family protein [Anaerolineales bacterium]MCB9145872.1 nitroreductase family protein [Anaerolineales bacterium]